MASRIFACLIFLAAIAPATSETPFWDFFPVNSHHVGDGSETALDSGLAFYFTGPPADHAAITATVVDCGREHPVAGEIDTDGVHGDTFFRFPIESLEGFHVKSMTLAVGRRSVTIKAPRAGEHYRY